MLQIPDGVRQAFGSAVDSIITNINGRPCKLFYPPMQVPCPNSVNNQGNIANDEWVTGAPNWVHCQQLCPLCNGNNFIMQEQTTFITMVVWHKPSQFNAAFPADNRYVDGVIQTKGFTSDLSKVLNCARMETYLDSGMDHYSFKMYGEPISPGKIIKSRYFYCLWMRT